MMAAGMKMGESILSMSAHLSRVLCHDLTAGVRRHVQVLGRDEAPITEGTVTVPAGERFVLGTEEFLEMPVDAVGSLWIRSSYARRGVLASFGKVDAGFHGNLTVGCFNASHEDIEIPVGDRFCQIVMEDLKTPPQAAYAEKSGNYQGQTGVTLAKN